MEVRKIRFFYISKAGFFPMEVLMCKIFRSIGTEHKHNTLVPVTPRNKDMVAGGHYERQP